MTPQTRTVLSHLRTKGSITRLEAGALYRIAHLPTRIFELKKAGHGVKTQMRKDMTGHRYARYSLA